MQDGCKSLHGPLHGIKWIMFHGHLDYSQKPPLGGRPNTNPWYRDTPNAHHRWFILYYHVREQKIIEIAFGWEPGHIWMTSPYTWGSVTTLHEFGGVLGRPLDTFLLGSHNFTVTVTVTALGSCVKWPLRCRAESCEARTEGSFESF